MVVQTSNPNPRRLTQGKEKGKSRDANIQRQNWLRMHYENKKKYKISRFLLNQNLLTGKKT